MSLWRDLARRSRLRLRQTVAAFRVATAPSGLPRAALEFAAAFTAGRTVLVDDWAAEDVVRKSGARSVFTVKSQALLPRFDRVFSLHGGIDPAYVSADGMFVCLAHSRARIDAALAELTPRFAIVRRFAVNEYGVMETREADRDCVLIATNDARWRDARLHIGCGPLALDGWINIDHQPYDGVDFRWDLARGIPFADTQFIFAEHFLEHLSYLQAAAFIANCRKALREDGVLRLSTPNLDWVWAVAYRPYAWQSSEDARRDCFVANRAFRAWGHQFLYNAQTLTALLRESGFADVVFHQYGESGIAELRGIERHPRDLDDPGMPHVLIVEARGLADATSRQREGFIADYLRDLAAT